jgi:uncharacterized protein DUF4345
MCLYLGMSTFRIIAALKPEWRHVAVIWAVFMFSTATGRVISLIVDGIPSRIPLIDLAVEVLGGFCGLAMLAREQRKLSARR